MDEIFLENCPFCGGEAFICGEEVTDFVRGEWAPESRKEFWVQTHCWPTCIYGNTHARAFGVIGGIKYRTPEAAVEAWNRRSK